MFLKQKKITDFLENFFYNPKFPEQSLLFWGEAMTGKLTTARLLAKGILCSSSSKEWGGCDHCSNCRMFDEGLHPDFKLLEPEKGSLKIDQIRQGIKFLSYRPQISTKRILIIDEADAMTRDAQNSFLKTLEEPPQNTIIILIANSPFSLLSTVRSRLLPLRFSSFPQEAIENFLEKNFSLSQPDIKRISQLADGRIGLACHLVDKKNQQLLSQAEKDLSLLVSHSFNYQSNYFTSLAKKKQQLLSLVELWLRLLQHAIIYHSTNIPLPPAKKVSLAKHLLSSFYYLQQTNSNPQLLMENTFLPYALTYQRTNSTISR